MSLRATPGDPRQRMIWPLLFGIVGCAVLLGLGTWQVQRMSWKQEVLAEMDARIWQAPVPLPASPSRADDLYLAVTATGTILDEEVLVMGSERFTGAGYRVLAAFETDQGRRVLVDRGFIPAALRGEPRPAVHATIVGNLHWPEDADFFTPAPDRAVGLWYARDVPAIAEALGTEPVLIVLRETDEPSPPVRPVPLDTAGVPDNHLNYAITWYLLALVWAGMTAFLLWRIRQQERHGTGAR